MPDDPDSAPAAGGYDELAAETDELEQWESPWGDSHYQEHYVWPTAKAMLPAVTNLDVLDAGCGIGHYTEWFLTNGATVVGVDASEAALTVARERCGEAATFYERDLTAPLDFASTDTFDLVFCNLVLDHIEAWRPVFAEFGRVLKPGGMLVFTTIHPFRRYLNHRDELENYHETSAYDVEWGSTDTVIESYYRPLEAVINPLAKTGFAITEFREARPQDTYERYQPERYEQAMRKPDTLCIRARLMSRLR